MGLRTVGAGVRCTASGWPSCCSRECGMADNRGEGEGGAMPQLDETAVEEDLQTLPGWERRGDENIETFACETSRSQLCSPARSPAQLRWPATTPISTSLGHGHPGLVSPCRGWPDRSRLSPRPSHPGARPAPPSRLTGRRLGSRGSCGEGRFLALGAGMAVLMDRTLQTGRSRPWQVPIGELSRGTGVAT